MFGPQKGADEAMIKRLEQRLDELAQHLPKDPRGVPMTGAAGGLSGGLWAAHGAALEPGAPFVLDALDFDERMRASRAVVTGEGKLDEQTLQGKLVGEIGTRTRQAGVPLHAIVGTDALDAFGKRIIDLQMVQEATTLEEMEAAGERLGEALATGDGLAAGQLRAVHAAHRPGQEHGTERDRDPEHQQRRSPAGDEVASALDQRRQRVDVRDRLDPAREQVQRHVHRREEQDDEHRHLHRRPGLDRAQPHRDARRPTSPP